MTSSELESQLRECFGRVVYSHKTHEKCADRLQARLSLIKIAQIILSALTTGGLLTVIFGDPYVSKAAALVSALLSTVLLGLNAYTKDFDPGQVAQGHKSIADRLWVVRERYLSLLTDIRAGLIQDNEVRHIRDELQSETASIYEGAPRTFEAGYLDAQKALKVKEDLTFSDEEIDQFLPDALKSGSND